MILPLFLSPPLILPVFSQNDGSSCGKKIILPPAGEICNNNDYQMEKAEMWYEFTANATVHEIILSPSETQPQAEITTLKLFENKCPELHLRQEVTTQSPELPRMRMEQLVIGEKYRIKAEREPRIEIGHYRLCLTRDEVGGGGDGTGGGGTGGGGGTTTVNCQPAVNPWVNPTGSPILNLCPNYSEINLGLGGEFRKVTLKLASQNDATLLNNLYIRMRNMYNDQGLNEPSISFENDNAQKGTWLLGVNFTQGNHFFRIGRYDANVNYTEFFRITPLGKVGIGTDNPVYNLDVKGDMHATGKVKFDGDLCLRFIQCSRDEPLYVKNESDPDLFFFVGVNKENAIGDKYVDIGARKVNAGWKNLSINAGGGNVGIGTNNPQYKLDVNGDMRVNGKIFTTSTLGMDVTGNLKTTGYIKSGNSIYIDGTQTGSDESNKIISSQNLLSILGGTPTAPSWGQIHVGIGTDNPVKALQVTTLHFVGGGGPPQTHFGIRLEDFGFAQDNSVQSSSIWDIEPIANNNKLLHFKIFDGTQKTVMTMNKNLFVGIGTEDPQSPLHIFRASPATGQNELLKLSCGLVGGTLNEPVLIFDSDGVGGVPSVRWKIGAGVSAQPYLRFSLEQTVGSVVTVDEFFRISYNGDVKMKYVTACKITAGDFFVETVAGCPDFVFGIDYRLPSLTEVAKFINENNHLKGIPSAKEMQENGISVNDLQMKLLQKVEELTLYAIEQEKRINELDKEIRILKTNRKQNYSKE